MIVWAWVITGLYVLVAILINLRMWLLLFKEDSHKDFS